MGLFSNIIKLSFYEHKDPSTTNEKKKVSAGSYFS